MATVFTAAGTTAPARRTTNAWTATASPFTIRAKRITSAGLENCVLGESVYLDLVIAQAAPIAGQTSSVLTGFASQLLTSPPAAT